MQRFRAVLLSLGMVSLLAGVGAGELASQHAEEQFGQLRLVGASRVSAVDDGADRARAVAQIASHSAAFAAFYRAPGSRADVVAGRTGDPELMPSVITALRDLESLFPDSIASASFIDRSGAENARVVDKDPVAVADLDPDRTDAEFFDPTFALLFDKVHHSSPYRSESTGEWVVANTAKVNIGAGVSPALVSFEMTMESLRLALYSEDAPHRVRVVDLLDGRVVIDTRRPQDVDAPLGQPEDRSLRWVQAAKDGQVWEQGGLVHLVRHVETDPNVATSWAVVVSAEVPSGPWASRLAVGPLGLLIAGLALLALSIAGHVGHGRSLHRSARRDDLTGLLNRAAAREHADLILAQGDPLTVLLLDLDRFKQVNDSLGHHVGDSLLCLLGARLAEEVRSPGDLVARLGGDEFVVLLRGEEASTTAPFLCERLLRAVTAPASLDGVEVSVGGSIGIAQAPAHGSDYATLLRRADIAMYDAKSRRAGWQVYSVGLEGSDRAGLALDTELRRAVTHSELEVHFQPSFSILTGEVLGAEALVRWRHPDRGLVFPGEFVPLAEETGSIAAITACMLDLVLDQQVRWREQGVMIPVSVNVSAHDLHSPAFADRVIGGLAGRGLPGSALVVELTETALVVQPEAAVVALTALAEHGVAIAIDDFGTGYASLFYLRQFPVSVLKLDRSLVQGLTVDPTDAALVRWTVEMAHSLGLTCVAEGVEDRATLNALEALGCDEAQGFFLQVPAPPGDLDQLRAPVRR